MKLLKKLHHIGTYLLLAILLLGALMYSGTGAERDAIEKLTGKSITRWEAFNFYGQIIINSDCDNR